MRSFRVSIATLGAIAALSSMVGITSAQPRDAAPLLLDARISLGAVRGRLDHMAIDLARQRLFVAELGQNAVAIVDVANRQLIGSIPGQNQPQGVGFSPSNDTLYVANAGDGTVRVFDGQDYRAAKQVALGSDADNIRVDAAAQRIVIGYGDGGLALIDPATRSKVADIVLPGHPEGFQIDSATGRIFVNLPNARAIAVVDAASRRQTASWPTGTLHSNFPMALDPANQSVLVVFRKPATLGMFSMTDGKLTSTADTCDDADDLFVDARRNRVYVSCGAGFVDVFERRLDAYRRLARIPTVVGARTSLFVPELDRLFVAVRAQPPKEAAAIWVFRPAP